MFTFNTLKTIALLGALTGLLVVIGGALGGGYGAGLGFLLAAVMNFGSYWFSDKIALKMAGAREVSYAEAPQLHDLIARLAQVAGLPKPRVAIIESDAPNAFATGRNPQHGLVAVTTGIMRILNERELAGVVAHELGHIKNRDILTMSIAATIAGAVTMLAQMAQWAALFGGFGRSSDDEDEGFAGGIIGSLLMIILAPIAAMIIQMTISRAREYVAERSAAEFTRDPDALASALEKLDAYAKRIPLPVDPAMAHMMIVKPFTGAALQSLFSTHPATVERIARLRELKPQLQARMAMAR